MPAYPSKTLKFNLTICLALSVLLFGLTTSVLAAAVNFRELVPLVDIKIPGWTMEGKPDGTTVKQGNMSISQAKAEFKNGDQTLEIMVIDLVGRSLPFLIGQQMEMESSEETMRTIEVEGFTALEHYNTKDKQGDLNISVANRFWVKIEAKGIDHLKVLQDVAKQLDLKKLATLAK
jgi:hypothetical protein